MSSPLTSRPGVFISLEGPEGAGKSVQARLLLERLKAYGRPVTFTHEPGGTEAGNLLRDLLLQRSGPPMTVRTQALLMCGSRAQLVETVIQPALARGDVVLCDRFADSTLAYQGYASGLDVSCLKAVIDFATSGLEPDLTLLLDLPVDQGLARKRAQDAGDPSAWNRFEAAELAFHQRVREGYHALAAAAPHRWVTVDATLAPDTLSAEIWRVVGPQVVT